MRRSDISQRESRPSFVATPVTAGTGVVDMDHCPSEGCVPVLDDFSISLLRKMFELLDHWDRQPSVLKPM